MEKTVYIDNRGWRYKVMAGLGHDTLKARYRKPEKMDIIAAGSLSGGEVLARPRTTWMHMQRHMDGRKYSGSVTWAYDANTQKT